ncbi:hypothetical protein, partial [Klebsiella pneumoniae]|uniref:hypothetical protein n=1 Tax=Klebsiella pneumoniae TaxID=573 RepID=UPI002181EF46
KIGPDPRNFNQRVSLGRNDLLIRTFPKDNLLSGPIQRTSISGSQNLSSYKQLMPSTTPTISLYKSDESTFNDAKFASVVSNFYGTMLSNQITLGNEIESVIAGSLWDIYVD